MKSILLGAKTIQAILEGRKNVIRRVVTPLPEMRETERSKAIYGKALMGLWIERNKKIWTPPCQPNSVLYVRETWALAKNPANADLTGHQPSKYLYRADGEVEDKKMCWRSSVHMPKEAARLFLYVTDVHVERLQDAPISDVKLEKESLSLLCWMANPYVWAIRFERIGKEEAQERERGKNSYES